MSTLAVPLVSEQWLRAGAQSAPALVGGDSALLVPCVSVRPGRGRQPPPYGLVVGCTTCRKPPTYRDGLLVDCGCGAPANPQASPLLVRYIEDRA